MLGVVLLYVGIVLINNGLTTLLDFNKKSAAYMNVVAGIISVFANFTTLVHANSNLDFYATGTGLLFGITYLFVAVNWIFDLKDLRPYGWYSLFVAINAIIFGLFELGADWSDWRMAIIWWIWALLWLTGFIEAGLGKNLGKFVPFLQIFGGIVTAWVPGIMMLMNIW